jgi:D-amino peptidase
LKGDFIVKVFISADIEGIWGIVSQKQVEGDHEDFMRARKLMTEEVNIVCDALFNHGATEIVVNDSHNTMDNLLIDLLHPDVSLISGSPKELSMMQGIDESFDCAMLIGYHPKAGTHKGIFDHTYAGGIVASLKINGMEMGECGLNALVAGHFDVPVVLVSGDDQVTRDVLHETYRHAVSKALSGASGTPARKLDAPLTLTLVLWQTVMADKAASIPGAKLKDPTTVEYTAQNPVELYSVFRAMITMADAL